MLLLHGITTYFYSLLIKSGFNAVAGRRQPNFLLYGHAGKLFRSVGRQNDNNNPKLLGRHTYKFRKCRSLRLHMEATISLRCQMH